MTERVRIYEVGPRDGLQNEAAAIPTATKAWFIDLLADAGLREIEATSFVAPRAVPQLADAGELFATLERRPGVRYPALVPNVRGLARAEAAGVDAIAVITAATDAFTRANIGMTVDESLAACEPVLARAGALGWWRRGYVSTAFGCPYTGRVDPAQAVAVAVRLLELGVDEVCNSRCHDFDGRPAEGMHVLKVPDFGGCHHVDKAAGDGHGHCRSGDTQGRHEQQAKADGNYPAG